MSNQEKQTEAKVLIHLFELVVAQAWKEEQAFSKSVFRKKVKKTDSLCQGISRNVFHKVFGCFPNGFMVEFKVKEKTHIVVRVSYGLNSFVLDGAIKQFLSKENKTVFLVYDYPFKKELQTGRRWFS